MSTAHVHVCVRGRTRNKIMIEKCGAIMLKPSLRRDVFRQPLSSSSSLYWVHGYTDTHQQSTASQGGDGSLSFTLSCIRRIQERPVAKPPPAANSILPSRSNFSHSSTTRSSPFQRIALAQVIMRKARLLGLLSFKREGNSSLHVPRPLVQQRPHTRTRHHHRLGVTQRSNPDYCISLLLESCLRNTINCAHRTAPMLWSLCSVV